MKKKRTFDELMNVIINKTIEEASYMQEMACVIIKRVSEYQQDSRIEFLRKMITKVTCEREIAIKYIKEGFYIKEVKNEKNT